ncbi:AAA family ATPase [uncultured Veillonella sp.]|uniref:AAA family ATPase n=1 Tax=uncultured Veillonella sp. TaxID=159268 RepID=UPI002059B92F|nr:AAA family ATPase [uncultured Veillonella sp.]DAK41534.1 MAG TPA: Regulatory protein repA [Caudoviricetes sp.]
MESKIDLRELLEYIDPAQCSYEEWLNVGLALHQEGYPMFVWEEWSADDGERFHEGECAAKWESFGRYTGKLVTGATITQMAKENGWTSKHKFENNEALSFDSMVLATTPEQYQVVDKNWIEESDVHIPKSYPLEQRKQDIVTYLTTLFEPEEYVGYVVNTFALPDGKQSPTMGNYSRTVQQILDGINGTTQLENVFGTFNKEMGAWIRFNPIDGKGVKNDNVTAFRYMLLESDNMSLGKQKAILEQLELPIAAMVFSGGKSIHAIVKVDAYSYEEYRKRVDFIYSIAQKNGFKPDKKNRNPSRLSRMPGVMRDGKPQFLMATNIGKENYKEWEEWIASVNDDLPEPEELDALWDNMPDLAPPLIEGILREGHKMLIAGPSKAGKSFALIQLCISIAEGKPWFGFDCTQGKVLYVNLELDRASCLHRFKDVYEALEQQPTNIGNISIWNLRGKSLPMDQLAPKLIRRAQKRNYKAIIIDPIYKVITGDENSADQMANFCNQFDKVCTELKCAVIYCHHHSKGSQTGKRSMDRASGSGVFARDPDALLDLLELELENMNEDKLQDAPIDTSQCTAWRMEGTLREYPKFKPVDLWFEYPIHKVDTNGFLAMAQFDSPQQKGANVINKRKKAAKEKKKEQIVDAFNIADAENGFTGQVEIKRVAELMEVSEKTLRRYLKESPVYNINLGKLIDPNLECKPIDEN